MRIRKVMNARLVWMKTILVFFLILGVARLSHIQLYKYQYYAQEAMVRQLNGLPLEDYARGSILDRNYRSLTGAYSANRVVVFAQAMDYYQGEIRTLAKILEKDYDSLDNIIKNNKGILPFELTREQQRLISEAGLQGVLVAPYSYRYGPKPLAVHIVGQLGRIKDIEELKSLNSSSSAKKYSLGDWVGRQGLENIYEHKLKGGYYSSYAGLIADATGKSLPGKSILLDTKNIDSSRSDVITTLDADIQEIIERIMDEKVKKGAVVVMDRSTGEIMSIASRPSFVIDPIKVGISDNHDESYVNQATSLFPPGSIFKVVVAAAALSENIYTEDSYFCSGINHKPTRCWKEEGHGLISLEEAFSQSCNPFFVETGLALGSQKLIYYARKFGLDRQEIIGYPMDIDKRQKLDLIAEQYNLVNSSIGQGPVLVTPVQVTAMINTIANDGVYLPPKLVKEVRSTKGIPLIVESVKGEKVLEADVVRRLQIMMEKVTRDGVGQKAWVEPLGTAGKTGSAQLSENIDYVHAWFSGYGPLDNPKYTVTVLVREGVSGGETAAPIFREIMQEIYDIRSLE